MINTDTGQLVRLPVDHPYVDTPPPGHVVVKGHPDDIARIATDVQRRVDADARKAKRKAQRAARKRNR